MEAGNLKIIREAMALEKKNREKKIKALVLFAVFLLFTGFVAYFGGVPLIKFMNDPEGFRAWVDGKGIIAPILFIFMVLFQVVVAVVPGEPFEIAAGYAFGYLWGTVYFMVGSIIGSALIFLFVRKYGQRFCDIFFDREKINKLKFLRNTKRNKALFFIIFSIPGTPKDLLSYFAGLSDMSFKTWMFIASVGRIPSLITSVIGGGAIGDGDYTMAAVVFGVAIVLSIAGYFIYSGIMKKHGNNGENEENDEV